MISQWHSGLEDMNHVDSTNCVSYVLICLEAFWLHLCQSDCPAELMSFARRDTAMSMLSRTNSTRDLGRGLSFIMRDLDNNLPDSVEGLEDCVAEHFSLDVQH